MCNVNDRPSWQSNPPSLKCMQFGGEKEVLDDKSMKKLRVWAYSALIWAIPAEKYTPPMPFDVDNGLPGDDLWFGTKKEDEVCFAYYLASYVTMNTGNLRVHQWLMTQHPTLVAEYIQYDDVHPFQPLQLQCTVNDLV